MDMNQAGELVAALRRSAHDLLGTGRHSIGDLDLALEQIVRAAVDTVPGADAAGVTMTAPGGEIGSRNPTNDDVRVLDRLQAELGEGPCVSAVEQMSADGVVLAADLAVAPDAETWPRFAPRAVEHGYRSLMSTRLSPTGTTAQAALNLYSRSADAFDQPARFLASLFGVQAALLLHGADRVTGLTAALESRDTIGQAKGILMERFGVDADQAFGMLVQSSQRTNLKLTDVAGWLTADRPGTGLPGADGRAYP